MARLRDCIEAALSTGRISQDEAEELARRIDQYEGQLNLRGQVAPEAALNEAEAAVLAARRADLALKKRQARLQAVALHRATNNAQRHTNGVRTGIMSLLVKDPGGRAGYSNVDARATAILASYQGKFAEGMDKFRTKNLGFTQDVEGLRNMVRELFDTTTGDQDAAALAKIWSDTAEMARQRFNRAGGAIAKREDWGMPQWHDPVRVGNMAKNEWINNIMPKLDRDRMLDGQGIPLNDMQFQQLLAQAYDDITTNGLATLQPGRMGGTKLANRRQDHRVLPFRTAEDWLEYHDQFGHADLYATLTDHLHGMASDTALMELLGPNPEATWRYLRDLALKSPPEPGFLARAMGKTKAGPEDGKMQMAFLDAVWNTVSGKINKVNSTALADFAQAARNLITSARLGGAMLSAISDTAFLRQTSKLNGLPAMKVYSRMTSLLNPKNKADRLLAVKMELTADAWTNHALAANRFTEVTGAGFSAKAADFTMRASGLNAWTDAGRKAFGMEFDAYLADNLTKTIGELPEPLREAFRRYGITPEDWDMLRATDPLDYKGVRFFSVENLMNRRDLTEGQRVRLANKLQEMILTEMDYAVPMPDSRARAITTAGLPRGTIMGEGTRFVMQFKSFPITVIATHLYRGALLEGTGNKAKYLASLTIATTVMGGIAMQSKEISRGKDPRDMTDPKFWAAAYLQGGGAGIYGDFLMSDANRFGKGAVSTMGGPMVSALDDVTKLTLGNVQQGVRGESMNLGGDVVNFLRSYTPASSLWYTRLGFERLVMDQLSNMVDPNAGDRFRRIQRRRAKDFNQSFWWKPGRATPERPPSPAAAGGQ